MLKLFHGALFRGRRLNLRHVVSSGTVRSWFNVCQLLGGALLNGNWRIFLGCLPELCGGYVFSCGFECLHELRCRHVLFFNWPIRVHRMPSWNLPGGVGRNDVECVLELRIGDCSVRPRDGSMCGMCRGHLPAQLRILRVFELCCWHGIDIRRRGSVISMPGLRGRLVLKFWFCELFVMFGWPVPSI
jgi:hypothetical protein